MSEYESSEGLHAQGGVEVNFAEPLLAVDGETIDLATLQRFISNLSVPGQERLESTGNRRTLAERLALTLLLAQHANNMGLSDDPEVRAAIDTALLDVVFDRLHPMSPDTVTTLEIRAVLEAEPYRTRREAERWVIGVISPDQTSAEALSVQLRLAPQRGLERVLLLRQLAATYGELIDLGFIRLADMSSLGEDPTVHALTETLFNLDGIGEATPVTETRGGFGVFMLLMQRDEVAPTEETVDSRVRWDLFQAQRAQARTSWLEALRASASVEVNEALFAELLANWEPIESALGAGLSDADLVERLTPRVDLDTMSRWLSQPENNTPLGSGDTAALPEHGDSP